jgi:two-component sensor histidine kinase
MDIYSKKQKWKFALIGFAIIIGISSLFVTNTLVGELKSEERKKIELWAHATKHLVSLTGEGDYSLAIKVISENNNIPVILVDACDSILENRNFQIYTKIDSFFLNIGLFKAQKFTPKFLREELNIIKESGDDPIEINIIGDKQWIYYKDSALLNRLRFYPIYQLGFIGLFMFIAYFMFSASRRSEQNKVWAGMAKETAHQIGTPLSSLMAWTELLKEKGGTEQMVTEMEKDIKRLETITERFSKIGSKSELKKRDIVSLVSQSIEYLKARMPVNTEFDIQVPVKEIIIPLNSVLFEWVIENLVTNAVDAMKGKGKISVSITEEENKIVINISDTGDGIDRSIIKNIFKPGVTSKKRGWGLGLSLSKRIIEEYHKGSIFVMKSEKGKGTTFTIRLPKNLNSATS